MADLVVTKRAGRAGEVGLFVDAEVFEEQFSRIKFGAEVTITAIVPVHARYMRFSWRIANLVCDASEDFDTPEDARDHILIECRHFRRVHDKLRNKAELKPKPTRTLDGTEWLKLIRRMVHVAVTVYGIPESELSRDHYEHQMGRADEPPPHEAIPDGPASAPQRVSASEPAKIAPKAPKAPSAPPVAVVEANVGTDSPPQVPEDYLPYAKRQLQGVTDQAQRIVWFNSDQQWAMRRDLKIGIADRKVIERELGLVP